METLSRPPAAARRRAGSALIPFYVLFLCYFTHNRNLLCENKGFLRSIVKQKMEEAKGAADRSEKASKAIWMRDNGTD